MKFRGIKSRLFGEISKPRRQSRSTRKLQSWKSSSLQLEQLEKRIALSADPVLTVVPDQVVDEASLLSLTDLGTFSDVIEGSGSIGLNANDFSAFSLGAFDPLADVVIDTDALTVSGIAGLGVTQSADVGSGLFDIAVFTFDSFELDAGRTITATGSRPLALLSLSDITVAGTIDVSAPGIVDQFGLRRGQAPGPGGGAGGDEPLPFDGEAAAGAPSDVLDPASLGYGRNLNNLDQGGGGGAFGGDGGRGFDGSLRNNLGHAYGDLSIAIQGGSGGAAGNGGVFGRAHGGGGGGGVELGAIGSVSITGEVLALGADSDLTTGASGGGGAGGGILVHGFDVTVSGTLNAEGGGAAEAQGFGGFGGSGGGGRILLAHDTSGNFDQTGATITADGGRFIGGNGEAGADGVVSIVAVISNPVVESYDFSIDWGDNTAIDTGAADVDSLGSLGGPDTMGSFDGSHTYADDGVYLVTVTLNDDGGGTDTQFFTVDVSNVDPTADAGGPRITFDDLAITLDGSGSDVAGVADPLLFEWDFDNDFNTVEAVGESVSFDPAALGITSSTVVTVALRVSDGDGGVAIDTADVTVLSEGALVIDGTLHVVGNNAEDDEVFIRENSGVLKVYSSFNEDNPTEFDLTDFDEVEIRGRGGDDRIVVSNSVDFGVTIDGGAGNDALRGGSGDDLILGGTGNDLMAGQRGDDTLLAGDGMDDLFGGSGNDILVAGNDNDLLFGGSGRDIMIGGFDSDFIAGGSGDDILIGGVTVYDDDTVALDAAMAIWTSSDNFDSRVDQLTGSGGLLEAGVTVFDDDDTDVMFGGGGRDLLFADTTFDGGDVDFVFFNHRFDHLVDI